MLFFFLYILCLGKLGDHMVVEFPEAEFIYSNVNFVTHEIELQLLFYFIKNIYMHKL